MKASIRTKILGALFFITLLTFAVVFYYSLQGMRNLGRAAVAYGDQLGQGLTGDGRSALIRQAMQELRSTAADQAYITELLLKGVSLPIENIAPNVSSPRVVPGLSEAPGLLYSDQSAVVPPDPEECAAYSLSTETPFEVKNDKAVLHRLSSMVPFLIYLKNSSPHIRLAFASFPNGVHLKYPWSRTVLGFDPRSRSWYTEAVAQKGKLCWSEPYWSATGSNELTITCSKAVYGADGKLVCVLGADVSVEAVSREFITSQTGRAGMPFLVNSKGEVIAGGDIYRRLSGEWDKTARLPSLLSGISSDGPVLWEKMKTMTSGILRLRINNVPCFAAYAPIRECRWSLAILLPEETALKDVAAMEVRFKKTQEDTLPVFRSYIFERGVIFISLSLILLVLILLFGYFMAKHLTRPIFKLMDGAKEIGTGHLDARIELNTGDELERLGDTFNKMACDLQTYIRNLNQAARDRQRVESELKAAAEIQLSMLPRTFPPFPERTEVDIYARMIPAREVGGDLYDFVFVDDRHLFFVIGDVSGKGMPAALFMATAKTLMRGFARNGLSPAQILHMANNYLADENESCMFITVFCGILDCSTGEAVCCNAGHNPPLRLAPDGNSSFLRLPPGFPLGPFATEFSSVYKEEHFTLAKGEVLFLYTDGVTEALNPRDELFGEGRLELALAAAPPESNSLKETTDVLLRILHEHVAGAPQSDDITMMMIQFNGEKTV
ncbi:MAG: Phosphoserine phosphatase RsbU [Lentisphaerae bacterium ADurb.Bin242]|nr:MAG: Phosphoserine phosphatase RsbU [Lentisphaerae bacterium ADurb.Bin242]